MKKKILIFIGIITLTLSFLSIAPKIKAQTNTRLVVQSYNLTTGDITFYNYETQEFFGTFNFNYVWDEINVLPIIANKETIPYVFRLGDIYELLNQTETAIVVKFVKPTDRLIYYTLNDMVEYQVYEYKGIVNNMYVFQQGLNFYQVPMTQGITFVNEISGEITFITILKPGNFYVWWETLNEFHLDIRTPDYIFNLGYGKGQAESSNDLTNVYRDGYEAGIKLAEGQLESEYQRGLQNGTETGYSNGYNEGYQTGFDNAYNEIISTDEYTLGYENGFKEGEKSKLSKNTESFYTGIEKWLVPAIITVIVLGGIMSIAVFKRREQ